MFGANMKSINLVNSYVQGRNVMWQLNSTQCSCESLPVASKWSGDPALPNAETELVSLAS